MKVPMFPRLITLDVLSARLKPSSQEALSNTAIIACQHLLETTGSLFEYLFENGLRPSYTFILGKVYSTNSEVANGLRKSGCYVLDGSKPERRGTYSTVIQDDSERIWKQAEAKIGNGEVDRIIILDDGAYIGRFKANVLEEYRHRGKVVGIEQTTSGMPWWNVQYPVINVASSAAKRNFEPPLVAKAIWKRVPKLCKSRKGCVRYGIIGLGKIGTALFELLQGEGLSVFVYDIDPSRMRGLQKKQKCKSVSELVCKSDIILGCAGNDSVPISAFDTSMGIKTFASCSSNDTEYRSLLMDPHIPWKPISDNLVCPVLEAIYSERELSIRILRSGYPINFDNTPESIPKEDIQLTRALLFGAVLQSMEMITKPNHCAVGSVMLCPEIQKTAIDAWRSITGNGQNVRTDWCRRQSRGKPFTCTTLNT